MTEYKKQSWVKRKYSSTHMLAFVKWYQEHADEFDSVKDALQAYHEKHPEPTEKQKLINLFKALRDMDKNEAEAAPDSHHEEMLSFIEMVRDSFVGAEDVYTRGSCVRFAFILERVFPGGQVMYNINHAVYRYGGLLYDITGNVENDKYEPLSEMGDREIYKALRCKADLLSWRRQVRGGEGQSEKCFDFAPDGTVTKCKES